MQIDPSKLRHIGQSIYWVNVVPERAGEVKNPALSLPSPSSQDVNRGQGQTQESYLRGLHSHAFRRI